MESKSKISLEKIAEEIDNLIDSFKEEDESVKERVKKLIELIEEFNRIGIKKIVKLLKEHPEGKSILMTLVKEPEVYALFLKHGIIKPNVKTQIAMVLEKVRPYVKSHGGDIEFVELQGDTVIVKMYGSCVGCSQIETTLREGILEIIKQKFPQINNIRVIPVRVKNKNGKEKRIIPLDTLKEGEVFNYKDEDVDIILIQYNGGIYAYYNACPHQGLSLENGDLSEEVLTCPWHGFKYLVTSGECLTVNYLQLEPVEIFVKDNWIWARV